MPTNAFNEAEAYLLQNWQQACQVETSMKEIRAKYTAICDKIIETFKDLHGELDWSENNVKSLGAISIGCEKWKTDDNYASIGIECIKLENLLDNKAEHPFIGIYLGSPKKPAMNAEQICYLCSKARTILTIDQLNQCGEEEPCNDYSDCGYEYQIWYYLPDGQELLNMLLDGDGQRFVDCLVEQFEVFAKFIPVLDEIFPVSTGNTGE
jgi:hypothetical protein